MNNGPITLSHSIQRVGCVVLHYESNWLCDLACVGGLFLFMLLLLLIISDYFMGISMPVMNHLCLQTDHDMGLFYHFLLVIQSY